MWRSIQSRADTLPPVLRVRTLMTTGVVLAAAVATAGCGSSDDSSSGSPPQPRPTASAADFPAAKGMTLQDLQASASEGPVLAPAVSLMHSGATPNRFGFALFDTARKQLTGAQVAVYTARRDGSGLRGPFVARDESLAVKPAFESRTTSADPDAAKAIYVADLPFAKGGKPVVTALARLDGRLVRTNAFSVQVDARGAQPPGPGDKAIRVHTPTLASVGGDASKIDTRTPPATELLKTDFADVLGKKPVVLTFATPLLCQSRVCGPVVDVVEQVRSETKADVAFIHQEIYQDNKVNEGVTPQVAAWRLQSEPWTFVIDRNGVVRTRFEGAMSAGELQRAVAEVAGQSS